MQNFRYVSPGSLEEALNLLSKHGEDLSILAGGTNLMLDIRTAKTL
jgi:CO/xanthine dehydrogenase FAD-binding subunit